MKIHNVYVCELETHEQWQLVLGPERFLVERIELRQPWGARSVNYRVTLHGWRIPSGRLTPVAATIERTMADIPEGLRGLLPDTAEWMRAGGN
jgi:hypothetical protein